MTATPSPPRLRALIDYEDAYVQPLLLAALAESLPAASYELVRADAVDGRDDDDEEGAPLLQVRAYEALDFGRALAASPRRSLVNAFVIRKALIRKHHLAHTVLEWVTKRPGSCLSRRVRRAEHFELDYAEFLDDALVEAWDLRASLAKNATLKPAAREWWILKPGMSDRGQGIRLFSTERELFAIFEAWEAGRDDGSEDEQEDDDEHHKRDHFNDERLTTSHLRHFVAQPYVHPPLLVFAPPYGGRKFHIRTYVVAAGALRVFVFRRMLALFASRPYAPPWETLDAVAETEAEPDGDHNDGEDQPCEDPALLERMRGVHLTNTCVQTAAARRNSDDGSDTTTRDAVHLLSSLPLSSDVQGAIDRQIDACTAELFRAALAQPTAFQPLPGAFEVFGLDFLVEDQRGAPTTAESEDDAQINVQLLEVNAFPDFAQTGPELRDNVVKALFKALFTVVVAPHFGITPNDTLDLALLTKVLDLDLGRR